MREKKREIKYLDLHKLFFTHFFSFLISNTNYKQNEEKKKKRLVTDLKKKQKK